MNDKDKWGRRETDAGVRLLGKAAGARFSRLWGVKHPSLPSLTSETQA